MFRAAMRCFILSAGMLNTTSLWTWLFRRQKDPNPKIAEYILPNAKHHQNLAIAVPGSKPPQSRKTNNLKVVSVPSNDAVVQPKTYVKTLNTNGILRYPAQGAGLQRAAKTQNLR